MHLAMSPASVLYQRSFSPGWVQRLEIDFNKRKREKSYGNQVILKSQSKFKSFRLKIQIEDIIVQQSWLSYEDIFVHRRKDQMKNFAVQLFAFGLLRRRLHCDSATHRQAALCHARRHPRNRAEIRRERRRRGTPKGQLGLNFKFQVFGI